MLRFTYKIHGCVSRRRWTYDSVDAMHRRPLVINIEHVLIRAGGVPS